MTEEQFNRATGIRRDIQELENERMQLGSLFRKKQDDPEFNKILNTAMHFLTFKICSLKSKFAVLLKGENPNY